MPTCLSMDGITDLTPCRLSAVIVSSAMVLSSTLVVFSALVLFGAVVM